MPIERLWRTISQQKTITKNERPFIYLLQAWQYLDNGNNLNAYKSYIAAMENAQQTTQGQYNFEFDAIALCISKRLAMTRHQINCYQRLQQHLDQHKNEPHSIIKKYVVSDHATDI
ncbi:hypothetical protein UB38_16975 [Photobacterium iliopiscarium]|nr:hypothetical protein UB38_16975 [Photobacterium iliopiscarium]